jgi:hypothetical protein
MDSVALLARLSARSQAFLVWKNADAAVKGVGDFDCAAPRSEWDALTEEFIAWASEAGFYNVVACEHVPEVRVLLAVPADGAVIVEVDLCARQTFRGATLFRAEDLADFAVHDPRGFRRLSLGSEALLRILLGSRAVADGRNAVGANDELSRDPSSGRRLARYLFGTLGARYADRAGSNRRRGMWALFVALEIRSAFASILDPHALAERISFRRSSDCTVLKVVHTGRRVNGPIDTWFDEVRAGHVVYELRRGQP